MILAKDRKVELNKFVHFDDILIHQKLFFSLLLPRAYLFQLAQLI
jgi:hypothetical protein